MSAFTTALASFALAAGSFAVSPVSAASPGDAPSVEVRHRDLDLTRTTDVARLDRRILSAARAVCGNFDSRDLQAAASASACIKKAIAAARPQVELAVARANGGDKLAGALPANSIAVP